MDQNTGLEGEHLLVAFDGPVLSSLGPLDFLIGCPWNPVI